MPALEKLIMDDYKRRVKNPDTTYEFAVRAIAKTFKKSQTEVKEIIGKRLRPNESNVVRYKIFKSKYKGMRRVMVNVRNEEITWHTIASDQKIEEEIGKLRERLAFEL